MSFLSQSLHLTGVVHSRLLVPPMSGRSLVAHDEFGEQGVEPTVDVVGHNAKNRPPTKRRRVFGQDGLH
jgi:hypothetical protein